MYFLATHEVFVQIINPWLRKEITYEQNSQTGQNLDPKTALSCTKSHKVQVKKAQKSTKENMAFRPDC